MYYSPDSQPRSLFDRATTSSTPHKKRIWWYWLLPIVLIVVLVSGYWSWNSWTQANDTPQTLGQSSISAKPQPTLTRTFGDLLKQTKSYSGWLAGVSNGNIVLYDPTSGTTNTLVSVPNKWYGPVSTIFWSPDRTKLAYLTLPLADAESLTKDAAGWAKQHALQGLPSPSAFPYGRLTVLDITSKQATQTEVEMRNTVRPLAWMDNGSIAIITQTIQRYSLSDGSVTTMIGAGNTSAEEQLQTPLAWDATRQSLYFTKVKQVDGQTVRVLVRLHTQTNAVDELQPLKSGSFEEVTTSTGIDLALSGDGTKLAILSGQGISYLGLTDGGVRTLPYSGDWLWLQQSTLSELQWLNADKLGFVSMDGSGAKVWAVWQLSTNTITSFGRGSLAGSWQTNGDQLALVNATGTTVDIVTPDWLTPASSRVQPQPLNWQQLVW